MILNYVVILFNKQANNNFRFCKLIVSQFGRQFVVVVDNGMRADKTF